MRLGWVALTDRVHFCGVGFEYFWKNEGLGFVHFDQEGFEIFVNLFGVGVIFAERS